MEEKNGLIIVHTGNGKGKTTAALGLAMRAWGDGLRVLILQFIKGQWKYGEIETIKRLNELDGRIELRRLGKGFQRNITDKTEHIAASREALDEATRAMESRNYDLIILDEINYAVKFGLITVDEVKELLSHRPKDMHVVLTGREAPSEIIDMADLVTEMTLLKHPYQKGVKAQLGIEF
ncbi:MAG: cob(I)yrinic acid a,c-diamide adenosyltransferase [Anaerovibrio sp.]|uniref:cob(I)yrinic acid a,c-diamide adenosyltransferase n=1 Tax=Anaerovibrio sp. TaxID=1872532 RepID=UPI0025C13DD9|nr:cob(I)yrinic acid a,c-diamide adenosyltransferase [Anaerovibrio sp.]MBE6099557.1 cob(I)yrinic acid a,c-diamide adenosyltransferase [Anaerovibrio sp.]